MRGVFVCIEDACSAITGGGGGGGGGGNKGEAMNGVKMVLLF